jgi:SIR2-like domain
MAAAEEDVPRPSESAPGLPETTDAALEILCQRIATQLRSGKVIPFLGAGANACGRPPLPEGTSWEPGEYLPTGQELADYLVREEPYPPEEARDLVRVAQYIALTYLGEGPLFARLRPLFEPLYAPNPLHDLLAGLPAKLKAEGSAAPYQLIVTTNYDDVLERALDQVGVPFSVIYYLAEEKKRGKFVELLPDGRIEPVRKQTSAPELSPLRERNVILKIHGAFNRLSADDDSYVITEDHYIDYLAGANVARLLPDYVIARMLSSHVLFLGYGMRDWNLRVILRHIWSTQERRFGAWAIQSNPPELDVRFWQRHDVQIENARLERWVAGMNRQFP